MGQRRRENRISGPRKTKPSALVFGPSLKGNSNLSREASGLLQSERMPTVLRSGPYRFYFYSHEPNEPPHVHVDRDDLSAKFWLEPIALAANFGFNARELTVMRQIVSKHQKELLVSEVRVNSETLIVRLKDGRTISVPLAWYPKLLNASPRQRKNWKIAGGGYGIHWPAIDEDLSTEGLLRGAPAPRLGNTSNSRKAPAKASRSKYAPTTVSLANQ